MRFLLAAVLALLAVDARALSMSGGGGCSTDCTFTSVITNGTAPSLTATGAVFKGSVTVLGTTPRIMASTLDIGTGGDYAGAIAANQVFFGNNNSSIAGADASNGQLIVGYTGGFGIGEGGGLLLQSRYNATDLATTGRLFCGRESGSSGNISSFCKMQTRLAGAMVTGLYMDSAQKVGIGTEAPASKLHVAGAAASGDLVSVSSANGTFIYKMDSTGTVVHNITPAATVGLDQTGHTLTFNPPAGLNATYSAFYAKMAAGHSGGNANSAIFAYNNSANGNSKQAGVSGLASTNGGGGINVGVMGAASSVNGGDATTRNIGGSFYGGSNGANAARNIGVEGFGRYEGSKANYGGYFALTDAVSGTCSGPNSCNITTLYPTDGSAALAANNGVNAAPILLALDNGTTAFMVADGGYEVSRGTKAVTTLSAGCGAGAQFAAGSNDNAGRITVQTTGAMTCVMTFNSGWPDSRVPACLVNNETTANLARPTPTNTQLTIAGTTVAGDVIAYFCRGL